MTVGGLILKKQVSAGSAEVSWEWHDQSNGVVQWNFTNSGNATVSGILFRATYPFGNAFWPIYEDNPAFETSFKLIASPLIDLGIENNSPPLGIIKNPDGSMFVAFIFTLSPGQSWSMLEGGFIDGMTPDYEGNPEFITAVKSSTGAFIINWDPEQCSGYNSQAGTSLPCPNNPVSVSSAVFTIDKQVAPLFHDIINSASQGSPTCMNMILTGIDTGNINEIIDGLRCAFADVGKDMGTLIKKG